MIYHDICNYLINKNIKIIFEVGCRDCIDTKIFFDNFIDSKIYCYECNPSQKEVCINNLNKINHNNNIIFLNYGLGDKICNKDFYPYIQNNCGASSFYKRIDFDETQIIVKDIYISTIKNEIKKFNIKKIDLLFMDVQGFELNILKGCENFIYNIKYILLEIPKENINRFYLKEGHSKYIGAPTREEIISFLNNCNFKLKESFYENELEENILFENNNFIEEYTL